MFQKQHWNIRTLQVEDELLQQMMVNGTIFHYWTIHFWTGNFKTLPSLCPPLKKKIKFYISWKCITLSFIWIQFCQIRYWLKMCLWQKLRLLYFSLFCFMGTFEIILDKHCLTIWKEHEQIYDLPALWIKNETKKKKCGTLWNTIRGKADHCVHITNEPVDFVHVWFCVKQITHFHG